MRYENAQLPRITSLIANAVKREELSSVDWKRQTDAVQYAFMAAQMEAMAPERFYFVDIRILNYHIAKATSGDVIDVKSYFRNRCHRFGLKWPRLFVLDTKSNFERRKNGKANLHVHGMLSAPEGVTEKEIKNILKKVFGDAHNIPYGRQIKISKPNGEKRFTFADRTSHGLLGKLFYMLDHTGTTYRILELNEGKKRSRKAPKHRGAYNKNSVGIAAGVPSNFFNKVVICDDNSRRAAQAAFKDWIVAQNGELNIGVEELAERAIR